MCGICSCRLMKGENCMTLLFFCGRVVKPESSKGGRAVRRQDGKGGRAMRWKGGIGKGGQRSSRARKAEGQQGGKVGER